MSRIGGAGEGVVIVQWCIKGMAMPSDAEARDVIDSGGGLQCSWWRRVHRITPTEMRIRLTDDTLDRHINHFDEVDPVTGFAPAEDSPFISLSAGTVSRDAALRTNTLVRARRTALDFGSQFGALDHAYLYLCWVLLSPRRAVEVEGVAEEVRDLNTYRRYSDFQPEGEIVAKVSVPDNQIFRCERWDRTGVGEAFSVTWTQLNPARTDPHILSNVREVI